MGKFLDRLSMAGTNILVMFGGPPFGFYAYYMMDVSNGQDAPAPDPAILKAAEEEAEAVLRLPPRVSGMFAEAALTPDEMKKFKVLEEEVKRERAEQAAPAGKKEATGKPPRKNS